MSRRTPKKATEPILVKSGNVTVKIYRVRNRGQDLYTLTYRAPYGALVRRQFADLAKARIESGTCGHQKTGMARSMYSNWCPVIAACKEPNHGGVRGYDAGKKILRRKRHLLVAIRRV